MFRPLLLILLLATSATAQGRPEVLVAVAANFAGTLERLEPAFEAAHPYDLRIAVGSTGQAYAQIRAGAPYDAWLAADQDRPARLEAEGGIVEGSRFTYATGRLVAWSARDDLPADLAHALADPSVRFIAIANPDLAPYGAAAQAVLAALGVDPGGRLVQGQNVGQAHAMVATGSADIGFVAAASVQGGQVWAIDPALYPPIRQDAVRLRDTPGAAAFIAFLRSDAARVVIAADGYEGADD
ncbi:molybdate ABC transporter substrate-binding protein [Actibacterium sp. XHP0104]|uniref:molybdate ABC transporter substrate-binding protein n=1 Tax=Actibacterium sp. XHP0104 TaxID=2984335 RepID=UPI0021E966B5|nr:molybdate ABC transporter substrate-binding protein [Actibacterium sp. XHP0104]MCV2880635.1 molybdate ABC transporter substrate-binding protein [Actibacterium sp. XHP0104]